MITIRIYNNACQFLRKIICKKVNEVRSKLRNCAEIMIGLTL